MNHLFHYKKVILKILEYYMNLVTKQELYHNSCKDL